VKRDNLQYLRQNYFILKTYFLPGDDLGNVKPAFIKRIAMELMQKFPEDFTEDFEKNKMLVERLTTIATKNVRNRVAGYITRVMEDRKKVENEEPT